MNLLLLNQDELPTAGSEQPGSGRKQLLLDDERATHILNVLRSNVGDTIKLGLRGGNMGTGHIVAMDTERNRVALECTPLSFHTPPPPPSPVRLFVALPRPKAARRIIRLAGECGVKALHFINGYKVEKSYWSSPLLTAEKIDEQIVLGLQQAMDTITPKVELHTRFKPFVEDELPALINGQTALVAHPQAKTQELYDLVQSNIVNTAGHAPINILLGPEGGFIPYELEKIVALGARPFSLGPRIYRTEVAIANLLGELHVLLKQY